MLFRFIYVIRAGTAVRAIRKTLRQHIRNTRANRANNPGHLQRYVFACAGSRKD